MQSLAFEMSSKPAPSLRNFLQTFSAMCSDLDARMTKFSRFTRIILPKTSPSRPSERYVYLVPQESWPARVVHARARSSENVMSHNLCVKRFQQRAALSHVHLWYSTVSPHAGSHRFDWKFGSMSACASHQSSLSFCTTSARARHVAHVHGPRVVDCSKPLADHLTWPCRGDAGGGAL